MNKQSSLPTLPKKLALAPLSAHRPYGELPQMVLVGLALVVALYLVSRANYPLFHSLADLAAVFVAGSVFLVVWHGRRHLDNHYYLLIAFAFLAFALLDVMHLLGNKGMGVFPAYGNLGPTFYIAGRYVLGISFFVAPLFIRRKLHTGPVFALYLLVVGLVLLSVLHWRNFPATFIEGTGLTPFKVYSDYAVCLLLLGGLWLLIRQRRAFDPQVVKLLAFALVCFILTGLAFTLYTDPFGIANTVGHLLQIASFYLIYRSVVATALTQPQHILYRQLQASNDNVRQLNTELAEVNDSLNRDIAARQQAEAALGESEARLRRLYAAMNDGLVLHEIVEDSGGQAVDYRLLDVNPAYERITGIGRDRAVGALASALYGTGTPPFLEVYARVAATGQPESFETEFRPMAKSFHISVFRPAKGQFATVFADITAHQQTEDELRHTRNLLLEGQKLAHLGSFEYVAESQTTVWSEEEFRIYGLDPAEASPSYPDMLAKHIHPDDSVLLHETFGEALRSGSAYDLEHRIVRPEGSVRWVYDRALPHLDGSGKLLRYVGATLDITDRKQAEAALVAAHRRIQSLIDNTPAIVYAFDQEGRFVLANTAIAKLLNSTPARMIGKRRHDFMPQADADWHEGNDRKVFAAGRALDFEEYSQLPGRSITWLTTKFPLRDAQGRIYAVAGISADITERKQAEDQLHRLNRTLQAYTDSNRALLRLTGEAEYLREVCRIIVEDCGYAMVWVGFAENDEGKTVRPVASAGFEEGYLDTLRLTWADTERGRGPTGTAIRTGKFSACQNMLTDPRFTPWRAEARKRGYASSAVFPLLADGKAFGALTLYSREAETFTDAEAKLLSELADDFAFGITTLRLRAAHAAAEESVRKLNAELEQRVQARTAELSATNRELEAFCYSVSHDLRAPLRSMDGFSQALLEDYGPLIDAAGKDFLLRIRSNSQRMGRLIDDLLNLSRLTRAQMRHTTVDLTALAESIVAELLKAEPSRTVDVRIAPDLTATGDPVLLGAALSNLLANAWKFTGRRPDAVIEFGSASWVNGHQSLVNGSVFFVRDNGVGFDMQYADKLFTPFQRLHAMEDFPGTGIGLATVQRVIHRHGGRVWFESAPGQGTTFYFTVGGNV